MKIKIYLPLLVATFILLSHNAKADDFQYSASTLHNLSTPVDMTPDGFSSFLKNIYNHPAYGEELLPNSFADLLTFLEHGKKTKQSRAYAQSVLRLFSNKIKCSIYVNPDAFNKLLEKATPHLEGYFLVQRNAHILMLQEKINNLLYARFLEQFSAFKSNPTTFLNDLSQDIIQALNAEQQEHNDISLEELRKTVLVFLESCASRLIWSSDDQIDTWKSVKSIAENLTTLMDGNILADLDDLNGLFITIIERYCLFLDLASTDLSDTFYKQVLADLNTQTPASFLLELEEQENNIESKKNRIKRALLIAQDKGAKEKERILLKEEVKKRAYDHGILIN